MERGERERERERERESKCSEHRAGERAAGGAFIIVDDGSGKGEHPYAPKRTEVYLALFPEPGLLKVAKASPWTVRARVRDAADKLRIRQADSGVERPISCEAVAWAIPLFGDENVLWAVSERVEHAAAGRLAHNVGASSVDHTEGKECLRHDRIADVDWPTEFHRAVCETLAFLGHDEAAAGEPRPVQYEEIAAQLEVSWLMVNRRLVGARSAVRAARDGR